MTTTISGTNGVSQCAPGSVSQDDLQVGVGGRGPAFSAASSAAAQAVPVAVTKVQLPVEIFDTAGAYDVASSRFQPAVPGYYQINGVVRFTATASGSSVEFAALYGTNAALGVAAGELVRGHEQTQGSRAAIPSQGAVSALLYMNGTTDYVELWGYLNGGSPAFNATTVGARCSFSGSLVRGA